MRRILKIVIFAISIIGISGPTWALDLQAHRGGRGLLPENTLPAFANALSLGVTTLELDTGITKDGVVVVSHNQRLDSSITKDAKGEWLGEMPPLIKNLSYEELGQYDVGRINPKSRLAKRFGQQQSIDGTRIPTLESVFDLVKKSGNNDVRLNIETKINPLKPDDSVDPDVFAKSVVDAIEAAGFENRAVIQSFDWRTLLAVQKLSRDIEVVFLTAQQSWLDNVGSTELSAWTGHNLANFQGSVPKLIKSLDGSIWSPFAGDIDQAQVDEAHKAGIQVVVWTVNEAEQMKTLLQMGVDGIITDYPDRLRKVLTDDGRDVPAATPVKP